MLRQIIESIIREDTTEQLDSAFDEIIRAISLRSAKGLGTDEGLTRCSPRSRSRGTHVSPVAEP